MIEPHDANLDLTERAGEIVLDWRTGDHYRAGRGRTCRSCFGPTVLVDDHGRPCHKLCAEADLESERHRAEIRQGVALPRPRPA